MNINQKEILLGVVPSKGKSIFSAGVARWLIKRGHKIIDIKPDKKNRNYHKTIFVFEETKSLIDDLISLNKDETSTD